MVFRAFHRQSSYRVGDEGIGGDLHGRKLLFEQHELHLRIGVLPFQTGDLSAKTDDLFGLSDGRLFKVRCDLLEGLDVVDFLQPRHDQFSQ